MKDKYPWDRDFSRKTHPDCELCKLYKKGYSDAEWCAVGCPSCSCRELWKKEYFENNPAAKTLFGDV